MQDFCAATAPEQASPCFLSNAITHVSGYNSIHLDVENVAHFGLQKSAQSRTVSEVMLEQMEGQIRSVMTGSRSDDLRLVHLHCDVGKWTVLQKGGTQASRDKRSGSSANNSMTRQFDEAVESVSIPQSEKEDFTSGYLFLGGIAALRMDAVYEKSSGKRRNIQVLLHGGSFAIQRAAIGVDCALLDISCVALLAVMRGCWYFGKICPGPISSVVSSPEMCNAMIGVLASWLVQVEVWYAMQLVTRDMGKLRREL